MILPQKTAKILPNTNRLTIYQTQKEEHMLIEQKRTKKLKTPN